MKKFLIGPESDAHWIVSGAPTGISVGTAYRRMMDTNSTSIYVSGSGSSTESSNDGTISKFNKFGVLEWSYALTEAISGPPSVGQFSGNSIVADDTYVCALHDMVDDNFIQGTRGVVHVRSSDTGTLGLQRSFNNGSANAVDTDGTYAYCLGSFDASANTNFWRTNLSSGSASNLTLLTSLGLGADISVGSSAVYVLNADGASPFDTSHIIKTSTSGAIASSVALGSNFSISAGNRNGSIKADSSDNLYFIGCSSAGALNVIKFNSSLGITWQKSITRSGWTFGSVSCHLDSEGDLYVSFRAFDGGSTYNKGILRFDTSGTELDQLTIAETSTPSSGITALSDLGDSLVFLNGLTHLVKYPKDFSKTGTYGTFTFSSGSDWTVASSSLSFSAGSLTNTSDTISFSTSTFGNENTTTRQSITKTDIR